MTGSSSGGYAWVKQTSASTVSVAYLLGGGFKFDVGKIYFLTNLDYRGSKPEFSNVETIASDGSRQVDTWSQTMGSINLSIGIGLKI